MYSERLAITASISAVLPRFHSHNSHFMHIPGRLGMPRAFILRTRNGWDVWNLIVTVLASSFRPRRLRSFVATW